MANQRIAPGVLIAGAVYINETATAQRIATSPVYVNETSPPPPPPSGGGVPSGLLLLGVGT